MDDLLGHIGALESDNPLPLFLPGPDGIGIRERGVHCPYLAQRLQDIGYIFPSPSLIVMIIPGCPIPAPIEKRHTAVHRSKLRQD
jgi:hypothetical protein